MSNKQEVCAYLGIGTNMGQRAMYLNNAVMMLKAQDCVTLRALSRVFESAPMYMTDQPVFWNACLEIKTTLSPEALLALLLHIESAQGRVRDIANGPRTLDLDILFYGQCVLDSPTLNIPHPKLRERNFVLGPMMDLAPKFICPGDERLETYWQNLSETERQMPVLSNIWHPTLLGLQVGQEA